MATKKLMVLVCSVGACVASVVTGVACAASYITEPTSKLEFVGIQAGAEFKGVFHKFTAAIDFAPDALGTSHFDVQIDVTSADTMDKDRDTTMRGPDVFDIAHFPTAHYSTRSITKTATGYVAIGSLTLHGVTKDVPIEFRVVRSGDSMQLEGSASLNRLAFGVGEGVVFLSIRHFYSFNVTLFPSLCQISRKVIGIAPESPQDSSIAGSRKASAKATFVDGANTGLRGFYA